ncbi:MAG TPA: NAD-dependent epimerase/dehydratase family protein [Polyangiaceae bacterium]|nr:NAD-dependent epimerase/dehydratase family protein [Polyangiaceae bacterium]
MSIAAVTGASGFIGSAVVRALLGRGRKVRALVEPRADLANLKGLDVEVVECDVTDEAALERGLSGVHSLFHLAAIYKLWTPDPEPLFRVNLEGTTAVLLAAQAARVKRVVFTSSIMAVGIDEKGGKQQTIDESQPFTMFDLAGTYTLTKYLSERLALRFARAGLPLVVVNPAMPFGPGDRAPTPTGLIILRFLKGEVPALGAGGLSVVDVDDVAEGHLLAEEKGRVGERYILSAYDLTLPDFAARIGRIGGVRIPKLTLPAALGLSAASLMEASARRSGKEPLVTYKEARFTALLPRFSNAKAVRELGFVTRPLDDTIARAIEFFRSSGMA